MSSVKISSGLAFVFKYQVQHLLILVPLYVGTVYLAGLDNASGNLLGIHTASWFYLAIINAIAHQVIVWFVFRFQLVYKLFTRLFGEYDLIVWKIIFLPFLVMRPIFTLLAGISDDQEVFTTEVPGLIAGGLLLIPAIYTLHSVFRYFGIKRAIGGDHFRDSYRNMPLVRKGMFKYSENAMYMFAFLIFWAIGLITNSKVALALGLFQHAYIWVHMFCTEQPDMNEIYEKDSGG